jgi:hypothetical protein
MQARLARCRELDELILHYTVHGAHVIPAADNV